MNHEEQAIQEAEQILQEAMRKQERSVIKEHQSAIPFLSANAPEVLPIDALGTMGTHIHLFTITQAPADEPVTSNIPNPLFVEASDAVIARLRHLHAFETEEDASECLKNMKSSIMYNEGCRHHENKIALFMSIRNEWFVLYAASKLTLSKRCGLDFQTKTTTFRSIDDTPEAFFADQPDMPDTTRTTIVDMLFFAEAAKVMEEKMPAVYKTMARRIIEQIINGEDDGE